MTMPIELIEEIQETYAAQYDLTILFTDEKGELVAPPKGENVLCNRLLTLEEGNLLDKIKEGLGSVISRPFVYDVLPGVHVVIAPVGKENGENIYLCAGAMVEEQTQQFVISELGKISKGEEVWEKAVDEAPSLTPENKQEWMRRAGSVSALAGLCFQGNNQEGAASVQAQLFREAAKTEHKDLQQLLDYFLENSRDLDFIGTAQKEEDELYRVDHIAGSEAQDLLNATFSPGESFLGRVLITGKESSWEQVQEDPRSLFFRRKGVNVKSLYCFQIKQRNGSISLLFGGELKKGVISQSALEQGKTLAAILESSFHATSLQAEHKQQLARLSSLVEISTMLASTPELKRILYILVDISLNLVEGPFSCVILKDRESDKIQLVSRGNRKKEIGAYAKEAAKRYFQSPGSRDVFAPTVRETQEASYVIECPLFHRDDLLGILCVGCDTLSERHLQEHKAFLHTLSIIGGVSLQLARQENEDLGEGQVHALHKAIEQFDPASHSASQQAAKVAGEFIANIGLPVTLMRDVINACQLYPYTPDFIREIFPESKVPDMLEEGKALADGKPGVSWKEIGAGSQVLAVILSYIENGESLETMKALLGSEEGVVQEFISFIEGKEVMEEEFTLTKKILKSEEIVPTSAAIKTNSKLSPREQEVLDLVVQGLNNREIAQKLYISDHTVKNHVTKIFQKLDVTDRAHAISKVYKMKYEGNSSS
ncbi:LuxR C-terminal-related transcriptional regulator [Thalassorhabdus alkalitolerans]|uniref:LuxR C-terminal-related transcriptional regulator n=1 Tax=Thalassorhabdus alkalitolerans TaxID=2282697 RepID=A0ABW0YM31_9BACI